MTVKQLATSAPGHTAWQIAAGTWVATTLSDRGYLIEFGLHETIVTTAVATALGIGLSILKNILKRRREQPNQSKLTQALLNEALDRITQLEAKETIPHPQHNLVQSNLAHLRPYRYRGWYQFRQFSPPCTDRRVEGQIMITETQQNILDAAREDGFRNCNEVFDVLGFEEINAGGIRRSKYQVATRWIEDAGQEVIKLFDDGYTNVPNNLRTGTYFLPEVVAAKNAYYEAIRAKEQESWDASDAALEAEEAFKAARIEEADAAHQARQAEIAANQRAAEIRLYERRWHDWAALGVSQEQLLNMLGSHPDGSAAPPILYGPPTDGDIEEFFEHYTGPYTRRGYPKGRTFLGRTITGQHKRQLWKRAQGSL